MRGDVSRAPHSSTGTEPSSPDPKDRHVPRKGEPWTPIRLTRWSGHYLREKGVESGMLDSELLLAHVLGTRRLDLYLQHDRPLLPRELDEFRDLLKRRAAREPLQHIVGTVSFREIELKVDRRALIPRPETEVLVEEILVWSRETGIQEPEGLDVGTGTGAITLSLLREGPFRRMVATDSSAQALELASENARDLGLDTAVEFRQGEGYDPVRPGERFHLVTSNPPYIPLGDRESLAPEVRDWDPPEALFAGPEGLDILIPLVRNAGQVLLPGGLLALEVGSGQAGRVARAMEEVGGFREIRIRPDLGGRERIVLGVA